MSGETLSSKLESLAERLAALSPGDTCPCCGAVMELGLGRLGSSSLMCRVCGCELESEEWPQRTDHGPVYCLAA